MGAAEWSPDAHPRTFRTNSSLITNMSDFIRMETIHLVECRKKHIRSDYDDT